MPVAPEILLVLATVVTGYCTLSCLVAWVEGRRPPLLALGLLAVCAGAFVWVHLDTQGGLAPRDIPDAFILLLARILG